MEGDLVNSRVIYTIKANANKLGKYANEPKPWLESDIDEWSIITLNRMQLYADRVGADLVVIDESKIREMKVPDSFNTFQIVNMLKFYILDTFSKSEYENMLFLDLDILVRRDAENIFETVPLTGFHMTVNKNDSDTKTYKELIHKHYFEHGRVPPRVFKSLVYNGGIIYADNESVQKFCKKIPSLFEWDEFFKSHNLRSNPFFDGVKMNEQHLISMFLSLNHFKVKILDTKWNVGLFYQDPSSNFVHYFGPAGKEILNKLNKRNENGFSGNLCFYD
tara:strand:- start:575 stop:1405 length:831 start_codon:yes stop_codon:yes gene_type:complete